MSYAKYQKKIEAGEAFRVDQGTEHLTFTRKSSRKNKLVFVALLIVLIIAIVFIVLYALQIAKSKPTATDAPLTAACGPADCVLIASGQFSQHSLIFFHDAVRLYLDMKCFGLSGRLLSALHLVLFVLGT